MLESYRGGKPEPARQRGLPTPRPVDAPRRARSFAEARFGPSPEALGAPSSSQGQSGQGERKGGRKKDLLLLFIGSDARTEKIVADLGKAEGLELLTAGPENTLDVYREHQQDISLVIIEEGTDYDPITLSKGIIGINPDAKVAVIPGFDYDAECAVPLERASDEFAAMIRDIISRTNSEEPAEAGPAALRVATAREAPAAATGVMEFDDIFAGLAEDDGEPVTLSAALAQEAPADAVEFDEAAVTPVDSRISVSKLFSLMDDFRETRRRESQTVGGITTTIRNIYNGFGTEERVKFFAQLYDWFAGTYNKHMYDTGHFKAIENAVFYAAPFLRYPILDPTAGTGVPLRYVLQIMDAKIALSAIIDELKLASGQQLHADDSCVLSRARDMGLLPQVEALLSHLPDVEAAYSPTTRNWAYVNEVSPGMLAKAREELDGYRRVVFTNHDAGRLTTYLIKKNRINTAFVSQTFHIISDKDKVRLVQSLYGALAPGGIAVVVEEDPFRVSPSAPIEPVALLIQSIASPIPHRSELINLFKSNGFTRLEERAVSPIDEYHAMRLYLFRKPDTTPNEAED